MKRQFLLTTIFSFCVFNNSFADNLKITSDNFVSTIQSELKSPDNTNIMEQLLKHDLIKLNLSNDVSEFITDSIDKCIKKLSSEFKLKNIVKNRFETETGKYLRKRLIKKINHSLFKENECNDWCLMSNPKKENTMIIMPLYTLEKHDDYEILMNISCWYDTENKTTTLKRIQILRQYTQETDVSKKN